MSIRVWLSAFVVLFAIAELFEWLSGLGSWQPTGVWLILGGMGLATLSNIAHLPKSDEIKDAAKDGEPANLTASGQQKATNSDQPVAQVAATQPEKIKSQVAANEFDSDSISFKVRPLKR